MGDRGVQNRTALGAAGAGRLSTKELKDTYASYEDKARHVRALLTATGLLERRVASA